MGPFLPRLRGRINRRSPSGSPPLRKRGRVGVGAARHFYCAAASALLRFDLASFLRMMPRFSEEM
jgi:hypothetical protein